MRMHLRKVRNPIEVQRRRQHLQRGGKEIMTGR
jgi:hypothetical protein